MTPAPRVAVVVLNWNRWPLTLTCLESLFRLDYPELTVIVCDNDSADDSPARVRAWASGAGAAAELPRLPGLAEAAARPVGRPIPFRELTRAEAESGERRPPAPLTLVHTGGNLGFAGGSNVGIRHALAQGADYVWLLNNDTVVPPGSLSALVRHASAHPELAMCGSTLLRLDRPDRVIALGGGRVRPSTGHVWNVGFGTAWPPPGTLPAPRIDYVHGAAMLVARAFLERAGLMDEGYFLYYEELDWAARLPPGMGLGWAPESVVYHAEGGTTGGMLLGRFYRSMLRFTRLHHPGLLPLVLARTALRVPEAVATRNWRQLAALISLVRPS